MGGGNVIAGTHDDVDARLTRDARQRLGLTADAGHGGIHHGSAARTTEAQDLLLLRFIILKLQVVLQSIGVAGELTEGAHGVRAGVIGEIGISELFNDAERRVLRASAIAHKKTGAGVLVHINPWTENGRESCEILLSAGVPADRIAISHIDVENHEDYVLWMLKQGVYVEFDNFGKEYFVEKEARHDGYGCFVTDVERVLFLKKLIEMGYVNQILASCDVCLKTCLRTYGAWGYDHVLANVVPMMQEFGISDADIDTILRKNPADFLCGKE